ncbi:helix-turn-helix domain-containing protein [Flavobacterium ginsenosidimutans]|uniref:helix-turn-helix domain-containing protein n=1 Tax=Flavobacterium ginsenosidimutans TaxID=687844 RepID=UPI000DAD686C|nr:helix-turn-helix domain-containing protein [Flavobacterium ginsenosidimutans]KAF2338031.1 helix-turn-helix domain-containing protein [Flavobacterium ginsenosidimutans]
MNNQILLNGITIEQLAEALKELMFKSSQDKLQTSEVFLTRDEVCELLSFNKTSLWKHTKSGKLKSYGIGNRVYYKRNEVLEAVKPINS